MRPAGIIELGARPTLKRRFITLLSLLLSARTTILFTWVQEFGKGENTELDPVRNAEKPGVHGDSSLDVILSFYESKNL